MPQTIDNMSVTWTNSLTTYTGIKLNAAGSSDANSAAGSLLMDLQVGGSSRFNVSKAGTISSAATGAAASVVSSANFKIYSNSYFAVESGGGIAMTLERNAATGLRVGSTMPIGWASTVDAWNNAPDLFLTRRAAANLRLGAADTGAVTSTVTITIAAPGVVTWTSHGFSTGTPVVFTTTGALPTGITAGTTYYAVVVDANTFQIASSVANAIAATPTVITTSGSQSGTHTGTRYNITQRLSMQGITGVADRLGADLIIQGSQGTGDKAGGSIIFQVAPAGSSGTAQNALATALTIATATQSTSFRIAQTTGYAGGNTASLVFVSSVDAVLGGIISNGQSGEIRFGAFNNGGYYPTFYSNNVERWRIDANGHFLAGADNQYDIGATSSGRPRNVFLMGNIRLQSGIGIVQTRYINNASDGFTAFELPAGGNGHITFAVSTTAPLFRFCGTTSSFPALKRDSTTLQARLADDSAFASVQGKITTETAYTAGAPTATGYLVLYDSNGTAYRVPAVLN